MGTEGDVLGDFAADFADDNPDADGRGRPRSRGTPRTTRSPTPSPPARHPTSRCSAPRGWASSPRAAASTRRPRAWSTRPTSSRAPGAPRRSAARRTACPWYVETRVLYYRTDLAEKAGWAEAPQSWDDLKQFAKDLQDKAGVEYGISLPAGGTGSWQTFMPFAWSNGAALTNEDGTEYTMDSPEMTEALEYYSTFFDEGLSSTALLDAGELESGFADGTFGSFISGPWHTGLVEDAGVSADQYAVVAAARQGQRARHVVHRWWRPGRVQRLRQQGRRLEVRPVAERARRPSRRSTTRSATCRRSSPPGTPASSPTTRSCRSSASSSRAPMAPPAVPTWEEVADRGRQRDREGDQGRDRARRGGLRHAEAGRVRSAPGSDAAMSPSTATEVTSPDRRQQPRSGDGPSPSRHVDPTRRQQAIAAWMLALPFTLLFLAFTLGPVLASFGHELHRHAAGRHPFAVRGAVRRAGQLRQADRGPALPQGHPQHACSTCCWASR